MHINKRDQILACLQHSVPGQANAITLEENRPTSYGRLLTTGMINNLHMLHIYFSQLT